MFTNPPVIFKIQSEICGLGSHLAKWKLLHSGLRYSNSQPSAVHMPILKITGKNVLHITYAR